MHAAHWTGLVHNSWCLGTKAAAFCITVIAGFVFVIVIVVVVDAGRQRSVSLDLRQGWFGDDARACFGPWRQEKHQMLLI